jgi:hypothetical protein
MQSEEQTFLNSLVGFRVYKSSKEWNDTRLGTLEQGNLRRLGDEIAV